MAHKADIYTRVTNKIIADLEKGIKPWHKPWNADHLGERISKPLRHNGVLYQGINIILLWAASVEKSYASPIWITYRQAVKIGGQVRKGSKGEQVVYANTITKTETDDQGEEIKVETLT